MEFLKPLRAASSSAIDQKEKFTVEEESCNSDETNPMDKAELALDQTLNMLLAEMDAMIRQGVKSFDQNDVLKRELVQLKDLNANREREIQRLRAFQVDSHSSLTVSRRTSFIRSFSYLNLIEAVKVSKASAHNTSRAVKTETSNSE